MRILVVEDERRLAQIIKKGLAEEGFAIDVANNGEEGKFLAESEDYDLIILDLMLPKIDGLTVLKDLRHKNIKTPVLLLTAKSAPFEKAEGLNSGADDYLTKPFSFLELRARIHALIRRSKNDPSPTLKIADLELDPLKHKVTRNGKIISLTPKEFSVLELLLRHKDEVVTRTMIIEHVWDYNFESFSNVIDVFIAGIRRKIDKDQKIKLIRTLFGVGYKISEST